MTALCRHSAARVFRCGLLVAMVCASSFGSEDSVEDLIRAGHWKRAREVLQKTSPSDARSLYLRARVEYAFRNYSAALPLAEKAVRMSSSDAEAHLLLGQVNGQIATTAHLLRQIGLVKVVKKEFDIAYSLAPENVDVLTALVEFHLRAPGIVGGDKKKAVEFANALTNINPPRGYLAQALVAQHEKNLTKAAQQYAKAAGSGDDYLALVTAASFFISSDETAAQRFAERAIGLDPARIPAYTVLARVFAHEGKWSELETVLGDSQRLVPDDLSPLFRAAEVLMADDRQLDRAETYLRRYLEQEPEAGCPNLVTANVLLGRIVAQKKRASDAVGKFHFQK